MLLLFTDIKLGDDRTKLTWLLSLQFTLMVFFSLFMTKRIVPFHLLLEVGRKHWHLLWYKGEEETSCNLQSLHSLPSEHTAARLCGTFEALCADHGALSSRLVCVCIRPALGRVKICYKCNGNPFNSWHITKNTSVNTTVYQLTDLDCHP